MERYFGCIVSASELEKTIGKLEGALKKIEEKKYLFISSEFEGLFLRSVCHPSVEPVFKAKKRKFPKKEKGDFGRFCIVGVKLADSLTISQWCEKELKGEEEEEEEEDDEEDYEEEEDEEDYEENEEEDEEDKNTKTIVDPTFIFKSQLESIEKLSGTKATIFCL